MRKKYNLLVLIIVLLSVIGLSSGTADAAAYPKLINEKVEQKAQIGDVVIISYDYYPAYANEQMYVEVFNTNKEKVAKCSKTFYNSSLDKRSFTVSLDTAEMQPGRYKVVATKYYYANNAWHKSPTQTVSYITLKGHVHKYDGGVITRKSTYYRAGEKKFTCACGNSYVQSIPKKVLEPVTVKKVNSKKKAFVAKWSINSKCTGYEIKYSRRKDMKNSTTIKLGRRRFTSKKITGLKSGKKYYVRVRAYRKRNGLVCFSKWSTIKFVKVK